jgi:hypothetical protein
MMSSAIIPGIQPINVRMVTISIDPQPLSSAGGAGDTAGKVNLSDNWDTSGLRPLRFLRRILRMN